MACESGFVIGHNAQLRSNVSTNTSLFYRHNKLEVSSDKICSAFRVLLTKRTAIRLVNIANAHGTTNFYCVRSLRAVYNLQPWKLQGFQGCKFCHSPEGQMWVNLPHRCIVKRCIPFFTASLISRSSYSIKTSLSLNDGVHFGVHFIINGKRCGR